MSKISLKHSGGNVVSLNSPTSAPTSADVAFKLPNADGTSGQVLKTDGSGVLSFSTVQGVPSGAVFCIAVATVPSDYLECNGAAVSRTTYAALFAVVGTAYGAGNGSSTFNLPDLRGEFIRGFDNGKGTDSGRSIASSQTSQMMQHTHAVSASSSVSDPGHAHTFSSNNSDSGDGNTLNDRTDNSNTRTMTSSSSATNISVSTTIANDGGTENRPRNIAMMYVIKT